MKYFRQSSIYRNLNFAALNLGPAINSNRLILAVQYTLLLSQQFFKPTFCVLHTNKKFRNRQMKDTQFFASIFIKYIFLVILNFIYFLSIYVFLNKLSSKIGNQNFIQFDLLLCSVSFLKAIHKEVTFVFMASLLLLESIKVK